MYIYIYNMLDEPGRRVMCQINPRYIYIHIYRSIYIQNKPGRRVLGQIRQILGADIY